MYNMKSIPILAALFVLCMANNTEIFKELQYSLADLKNNISNFTFEETSNKTVLMLNSTSYQCGCEASFVKLLNDTLNILKCNSTQCSKTVENIRNNLRQLKPKDKSTLLSCLGRKWKTRNQKNKIMRAFFEYTQKWFSYHCDKK